MLDHICEIFGDFTDCTLSSEAKHLLLLYPNNQIIKDEVLYANRKLFIVRKQLQNCFGRFHPSEMNGEALLFKHHQRVQRIRESKLGAN